MKYLTLIAVVCGAILGGCATGPDFKTYSSALGAPKEGEARIWFYRPSKMFGSLIQPDVFMNEARVGKCQPGCFFYVDRKPGDYTIQSTTEWADKTQLTVNLNRVHFVRLTVFPGAFVYHVAPKVVSESDGLKEIQSCRLITADNMNKDWKPPAGATLPEEKKQ